MRIFVLSRNPALYSTRRIAEAAKARGHDLSVKDTLSFTIQVQDPPSLLYLSKPVELPDLLIPRIGASVTFFGLSVVRQFEQMGIPSLNSANAIAVSRDKLRALQILVREKVPIPKTVFIRKKREILNAIEDVGGIPVVIKILEGTQGVGVVLAKDLHSAHSIIELMQIAKQNVLVQKFIEESKGRDIRAFVVGDRVVAAIRRKSSDGVEFRSNLHRGGVAEKVELSKEFESTAVKATRLMGLQVAGVDMLEGKKGPLVLEVNSSPGLEGVEKTTGVDIADEMIRFLEKEMKKTKS